MEADKTPLSIICFCLHCPIKVLHYTCQSMVSSALEFDTEYKKKKVKLKLKNYSETPYLKCNCVCNLHLILISWGQLI